MNWYSCWKGGAGPSQKTDLSCLCVGGFIRKMALVLVTRFSIGDYPSSSKMVSVDSCSSKFDCLLIYLYRCSVLDDVNPRMSPQREVGVVLRCEVSLILSAAQSELSSLL